MNYYLMHLLLSSTYHFQGNKSEMNQYLGLRIQYR